jgi:hypothetical protein
MPPQARSATMPHKQAHIWASRPGADSMGSKLPGTMQREGINGSRGAHAVQVLGHAEGLPARAELATASL